MAGENISANMSLPVPGVGVTTGPQFATDINSCLDIIDQHDHSSGLGVKVTPAGLNISSDLSFVSNNATNLRSVRMTAQASPIALASDIGCIFVSGVDLYFNDINGNHVRITQSGAVAGTPGSISNLVAPASAAYVSGSSTFVWQSNTLTPANMDAASYILRNLSASSNGLTLNPPAAMGSNFSITLPTLPASTSWMQIDTSGNITASVPVSGGLTTSNLSASAGIVGTQLANATLTGTQMSSNINLPGSLVTANSKAVVVSSVNAASSIAIIRGVVNGTSGALAGGEGFSSSRTAAGTYSITFTNNYADTPVIVATSYTQAITCATTSVLTNSVVIKTSNTAGTAVDASFQFIVMGASL